MYEKINGTINYNLFKIYSAGLIEWMKTFDPLNRKHIGNATIEEKMRVIYGNPERVYSEQNHLRENERIDQPVVGVYLTGIRPEGAYNIPYHIRFLKTAELPDGTPDTTNIYSFSKLKTHSIDYTVDIWSKFKNDIDYIIYSITREFNNAEIKYLGINSDRGFQYIPVQLKGINDVGQYEVGDAQDIYLRWNLALTIPNAYLPIEPSARLYSPSIALEINTEIEKYDQNQNLTGVELVSVK